VEPTAETTKLERAGGRSPVSLVIPRRAEYVSLCRLVAGAVGAGESLGEETIADLKLVVSEACGCFMAESDTGPSAPASSDASPTLGSLRIDFDIVPESWEITVSDPEGRCRDLASRRCDPNSEGGLGLIILRALVDSMEYVDSDAEGSSLRLVKKMAAASS